MRTRLQANAYFICLSIMLLAAPGIALGDESHAEVTRNADGGWWSRVNGDTVYEGDQYFDAVNAAINSMGAGTVQIRNSGDSGPDGGSIHAIRPRANQTLDFNGHQLNANGGNVVIPIYCDRRDNITVRDVHISGNPRYGIWFRGCSNVTLEDISMDLAPHDDVGLGIRVDDSTGATSNLSIRGETRITGSTGHGIETYGVEGFDIGDVEIRHSGGAGLILNNSRNGTVGRVEGEYNNQGGGYATFRVANDNGPNVQVDSVYSRYSGRGFFSVSGSHGTTIDHVDIEATTSHGIFLEDAHDTHVLSGRVTDGSPNCQWVRTESSTVRVSGCDPLGSGGGAPPLVQGSYSIIPAHSGLPLDVAQCSRRNGTQIRQWNPINNDCQFFEIQPVNPDGWHRISSANSPAQGFDVAEFSEENGANIVLWDYQGTENQQFRFQDVGGGQWQIINRHTGLCLDIAARSDEAGGNLIQWTCSADSENQRFYLAPGLNTLGSENLY